MSRNLRDARQTSKGGMRRPMRPQRADERSRLLEVRSGDGSRYLGQTGVIVVVRLAVVMVPPAVWGA